MLSIKLLTWFKGKIVGTDIFGNRYYTERFLFKRTQKSPPRRWVIFKGKTEASKVAAEWHAWLHFTSDQTPDTVKRPVYDWQREHMPNLSGTKSAYLPAAHPLKTKAGKAKHYSAWCPEKG